LVHAVLDRIQRGYAEPLTLQKCAGELRVNAAYLSHLFSRTVGLSFKTCLTGVRAEKAGELLSDPVNNISEVAKAVGYASANRFRLAFKSVTGLSPRMWRETLRMNPQRPGARTALSAS
jgi:two-component system response regulator YesN